MWKGGWRNVASLKLDYGRMLDNATKLATGPPSRALGYHILAMQDNLGVWLSSQIRDDQLLDDQ